MNHSQGFLAGTGFESQQPGHAAAPQSSVAGPGMPLVNLVAQQNMPPVCTGVAVPCRITVTNRFGEPREVIVHFHLPAQTPDQLKAAIENLIAMGFNIPAQRPFDRGYGNRQYNGDRGGYPDTRRDYRPGY